MLVLYLLHISRTNYNAQTVSKNVNFDVHSALIFIVPVVAQSNHINSIDISGNEDENLSEEDEEIGLYVPYQERYTTKRWTRFVHHALNDYDMVCEDFLVGS